MKETGETLLYTWYGVSDLMAALGSDMQPGPILNALRHGNYQTAYILGYTNKEKETQLQEHPDVVHELLAKREKYTAPERREICQRLGNTKFAHQYFAMWVKQKLRQAGKKTRVLLFPTELAHLNDTEQIYRHVMNGFSLIKTNQVAQQVTLFLSPGTPVMAFIWAFSSLRHPQLKLRLISSSKAHLPPEEIHLPSSCKPQYDSLSKGQLNKGNSKPDIVFHLFGEQRWPILQCVNQFLGAKHVFIYNEKYPPQDMHVFIGMQEELLTLKIDDPYDFVKTQEQLREYMRSHLKGGEQIVFNLTGGTKPMFIAAYQICQDMNCLPVYIDGDHRQIIKLNDNSTAAIKPIPRVDYFLQLNRPDMYISNPGLKNLNEYPEASKRKELAALLWYHRYAYGKCYKDDRYGKKLNEFEQNHKKDKQIDVLSCYFSTDFEKEQDFQIAVKRNDDGRVLIDIITQHKEKEDKLVAQSHHYEFSAFPNLIPFLRGIWLEEHTFNELKPLQEEGIIYDLRKGVELTLYVNQGAEYAASQEFDLLFTDGNALYVVECKSGSIESEHFVELAEKTRKYGGIKAKPLYITSRFLKSESPIEKVIIEKLLSSGIIWNHIPFYHIDKQASSCQFNGKDYKQRKSHLFELLREKIRAEARQ